MSLLMEALRKAEAAKRAGQQADNAAVSPPERPIDEPTDEYKDDYSPVPEVFKYTSTDDLLALSPRDEPISETHPEARSPEKSQPVTDDVLDDYLSDPPEVDPEELPPARPERERERVKVQQQRERAAAASMFNAKIPADTPINRQRRVLILASVLVVVAALGGGGWWYLMNAAGASGIRANGALASGDLQNRGFLGEVPADAPPAAGPASATAPAGALEVNAPVDSTAAPSTASTDSPVGSTSPPGAASAQTTESSPAITITTDQVADSAPKADGLFEADPTDAAVVAVPNIPAVPAEVTAPINSAEPATTLEITRSVVNDPIQPTLQSAYDNLLQGDVRAANELYQEVLTQFPNNRDAMLGFAAVQMKLGNTNGARGTYGRLLQLNPQDALARTGMLQTLPVTEPAAYETELLALKQRFPTLAPLSFALGNHYASTKRWHEAQSAYFDALLQARREPGSGPSPDYAFNLAVSLEQLGQSEAALEYYKQAQSLATTISPGFDPMLLRQRLSELERRQ